jgi:hypothetical protein
MIRHAVVLLVIVLVVAWLFTRWQASAIARTYPPAGAFVDVGDGARVH